MTGILNPAFLEYINGTMICLRYDIICHRLQVGQTAVYKEQVNFKSEVVGAESESYPTSCL